MWFNLDLNGIVFKMRIEGYRPSSKDNYDDEWCMVNYSFIGEGWLSYITSNDAVFLFSEIESLERVLDELINDKLTEIKVIEFIEPEFKFVLVPKREFRDDSQRIYIENYESEDVYMEMKNFFWNGGLTDNHLSLYFERENIEYFRDYLLLVMKKIDRKNPRIQKMLKKEIILESYTAK